MINIINIVERDNKTAYVELQGVSTDTKPTTVLGCTVLSGSTLLELGSKKLWIYDSLNINPATTNGWW